MKTRWIRVTRKRPCPRCGKPDWCGVSEDGRVVRCMRTPSDKPSGGGWLHTDETASVTPIAPLPVVETSPLASPEHRHAIYSTILSDFLVLSALHRSALASRGFSDEAIDRNLYRSNPTKRFMRSVCDAFGDDLRGVPGFYFDRGWMMRDSGPGFYVPVRDSLGRIVGMQLRRDEGSPKYLWLSSKDKPKGCGPGSPLHFAGDFAGADKAIITEGPLKADAVSFLSGLPVVAAAGVSNFGQGFAGNLRRRFPQLRTALVAFDSDFRTNEHVRRGLFNLLSELKFAGLACRVFTWERAKGIDDHIWSTISVNSRPGQQLHA